MNMHLEFDHAQQMAVLVIIDRGHKTEVRGHIRVGTDWVGDPLDSLLAILPRTINISALFADEVRHIRADDAQVVREWLLISA